ncbi:MAG: hypothetical protein CMH54_15465 [Myxococcales bacterium]|nr:hypothetical protein [Myxococcales bacterium]
MKHAGWQVLWLVLVAAVLGGLGLSLFLGIDRKTDRPIIEPDVRPSGSQTRINGAILVRSSSSVYAQGIHAVTS